MRTNTYDLWKDLKSEAGYVLIIFIVIIWFIMIMDIQRIHETIEKEPREYVIPIGGNNDK